MAFNMMYGTLHYIIVMYTTKKYGDLDTCSISTYSKVDRIG
jgi:hypothetical protein